MADANFLTGSSGLIAIDKVGNQVLFLDPDSYETKWFRKCHLQVTP